MQQQHFDAVVTDLHLPYLNGLELLAESWATWSDIPVIIISKAQWDMSEMATTNGVFAWIRKSSSPGVLCASWLSLWNRAWRGSPCTQWSRLLYRKVGA